MTPISLLAAGIAALLLLALAIVIYIYRHAPLVEPVREDTGEIE